MKLNGKQMMAIKEAVGSNGSPKDAPYVKVRETNVGYSVFYNQPNNHRLVASIDAKREVAFSDPEGERILNAVIEYWSE